MQTIYLDHAASTPLRPEVVEAIAPFLEGTVGNPSSIHRWGRAARAGLEDARERLAALLGTRPDEVRFVRGGTESSNLAIFGRVGPLGREGRRRPLLLRSSVEHSAVREPFDELESRGARVEVIAVDPSGAAEFPTERELAARGVDLVSFQWVNQETGIVLPVPEVARVCAAAGVPLHVDAVQAAGRVPLELDSLPIPLLSLSGHKVGAPKGTGVLIVRRETELRPLLFGGGQEGGLRPGTEDVAGAVGFARAFELAVGRLDEERERLSSLRGILETGLRRAIPDVRIHGEGASRAPHILGIGVPGLPRDVLPGALDLEGIGASAGSACRSGSTRVSPVLEALFGEAARTIAPLRLSLGWSTTLAEVEEAAVRIPMVVRRVREQAAF